MPVTAVWDNDTHTIIRHDYTDQWNHSDLYAALALTKDMLAGVEHPVDLIGNYLAAKVSNKDVLATLQVLSDVPPPTRRVIVVSEQATIRAVANVFGRVYPRWRGRLFAAATLEEARALLAGSGD